MIIGIDTHIASGQVTSIAKVFAASHAQIDEDVPLFGFHFADQRLRVKSTRFAGAKHGDAGDIAGEFMGIEFGAAIADGTYDAAPVGIGAVKGTAYERTFDNLANGGIGILRIGGASDADLYDAAASSGIRPTAPRGSTTRRACPQTPTGRAGPAAPADDPRRAR